MGKGRDGTVPRFFDPVPLVPRNNHAGESRENSSRSRSSRRLLSRYRSHGTQKAPGQIGTCVPWDSPASPDIYKLNYIKTKKNGLSLKFLSRFGLSRDFEFRSREFAGPGSGSRQIPGQPPLSTWTF